MLNKKSRSFVTIMIVIAVVTLALRFGLDRLLTYTVAQNESDAQATLRLIAAALGNYARDHLGAFPADLTLLFKNQPPYLAKDYLSVDAIRGYEYTCSRLDETGFSCTAVPKVCSVTGKKIFTITPGGLTLEDCRKKEQG